MSCKVKACRYNSTHVTKYHMCGKCNKFAHGQVECGNQELTNNLVQYLNDIINSPCEFDKCTDRQTHTTDGHICIFCDKNIYSHVKLCPENGIRISDDQIKFGYLNDFTFLKVGEYCGKNAGMGCTQFIRRNKITKLLEPLFMHSDNWGQYGEDISDYPRYKAFIFEYTDVTLDN